MGMSNAILNKAIDNMDVTTVSVKSLLEHFGDVLEVVITETDVNDMLLELPSLINGLVSMIQLNLQTTIFQLLLFVRVPQALDLIV
jgi:hypothetical protein